MVYIYYAAFHQGLQSIYKGLILCCMFEISPGGGGGGWRALTLIRRLGSFFFFFFFFWGGGGGVKILNFNIFGGFQKKKIGA